MLDAVSFWQVELNSTPRLYTDKLTLVAQTWRQRLVRPMLTWLTWRDVRVFCSQTILFMLKFSPHPVWVTESEEREISSPSAVLSHPSCSSLCSFIHRLLVCLNDGMFGQFEMTAEHLGKEFSILYKHFRLMQLDWVSARNVNATFAEVRRGDVYKGKND